MKMLFFNISLEVKTNFVIIKGGIADRFPVVCMNHHYTGVLGRIFPFLELRLRIFGACYRNIYSTYLKLDM